MNCRLSVINIIFISSLIWVSTSGKLIRAPIGIECDSPVKCLTEKIFTFCFVVDGNIILQDHTYTCPENYQCVEDAFEPCQDVGEESNNESTTETINTFSKILDSVITTTNSDFVSSENPETTDSVIDYSSKINFDTTTFLPSSTEILTDDFASKEEETTFIEADLIPKVMSTEIPSVDYDTPKNFDTTTADTAINDFVSDYPMEYEETPMSVDVIPTIISQEKDITTEIPNVFSTNSVTVTESSFQNSIGPQASNTVLTEMNNVDATTVSMSIEDISSPAPMTSTSSVTSLLNPTIPTLPSTTSTSLPILTTSSTSTSSSTTSPTTELTTNSTIATTTSILTSLSTSSIITTFISPTTTTSATTTLRPVPQPTSCTTYSKHPAPNCSQYYECVRVLWWWNLKLQTCPNNEMFDIEEKRCLHKSRTSCNK